MRLGKICFFLVSVSILQWFAAPCFAEDPPEVRAARVCAGMGEQRGNFQGTLHIEDLTVQGDGNGTVAFKRDGVDLGKMEPGTYGQFTECLTQVIKLISPAPKAEYKTCPDPSFGQKGWEKEENLHATSGWRSGGYNQGAFCSDFTNSVVSSRHLAGTNFRIEPVKSSEEERWARWWPQRRREYNYHCDLKLSTGPIYNSRTDPLCGREN
jgi:hypothetical protein